MTYTIVAILGCVFFLFIYRNHPIVRGVQYNFPDINDRNKFERNNVTNNPKNVYSFEKYDGEIEFGKHLILDDWKYENALRKNLDQYVNEHKTNCFIIIQNEIVLYEEYYRGMNSSSFFPSYSIAKAILSILTGIAINDGLIKEDQLIVDYIPELKNINNANKIRVSDLLNHTSGIKANRYIDAILYYGDDFWKVIKHIELDKSPGEYQEYQNINSQLLGLILIRTTKKTLSEYLEEKIWTKIGTQDIAYWNTFKDKKMEKCFCCFNAKAIDYAKFGKLILNKGEFNGERIVSEKWINSIVERNTTRGSSRSYNKSWYLGLEKYEDFMAIGLYKQFIYLCPIKNTIIIRFGEREKKLHEEKARWARSFREIVDQL